MDERNQIIDPDLEILSKSLAEINNSVGGKAWKWNYPQPQYSQHPILPPYISDQNWTTGLQTTQQVGEATAIANCGPSITYCS